ncbi:MAG: Ig-like domain-containing protein, partial [Dolichospermum sp.]
SSASAVCVGSTTLLTCATPNGVWSSSNPSVASINPTTGEVTGVSAGVVTITYTVTNVNGCVGTSTKQFTVNPLPVVPAITGNTTVCDNAT